MEAVQSVSGDFQKYWELTKSVWQNGIYGVDIGSIIVALLIFGVFFVLRGLFTRFVLAVGGRWAARTDTAIGFSVSRSLSAPKAASATW